MGGGRWQPTVIEFRKLPTGESVIVLSRDYTVRAPHDDGISFATGEIIAKIEVQQYADLEDAEKIVEDIRDRLSDTGIEFHT